MRKYHIAFLLIAMLFIISINREVQIPAVIQRYPIDMKLHENMPLNIPNFKFDQIFRKQVGEVKNKYIANFSACQVKSPMVKFNQYEFIILQYGLAKPFVIEDIKDIIYEQFVLDAFYKDRILYLMLVTGKVLVIGMNQSLTKIITQIQLDSNIGQVSRGYFFQNNGDVCFANANHIVIIQRKGTVIKVIPYNEFLTLGNFQETQKFQSVIALNQKYFAVAIKDRGVYIYSRSENSINQQLLIGKSNFEFAVGNLSIVDLQYDRNLFRLYVLDQQKGVSIFNIEFGDKLEVSLHPQMISVIGCYMIYLRKSQALYASCRDLVKVQLSEDRIRIHSISQSKLKVREIYQNEDFLIVAGRSMFQLFYRGKLVEYVQDQFLDKLLIVNDTWISVNQYSIKLGKYQILQQRIQCKMDAQSLLGNHRLQVKTLANCDKNYLIAQNITSQTDLTHNDICWYTNYVDIKVWKSSGVALIPIAVAMIILIISVWVIGFGWCIAKIKKATLEKEVDQYQRIGDRDQGHIQLVEQNNVYSQKQSQNIEMQGKYKSEAADKQLYAIE